MNAKRLLIITLGCKVNQYESDGLAMDLAARGFCESASDGAPEICIVNTCAVTAKAAAQSRQAIRHTAASHPGALIVATGCLAQHAAQDLAKIPGVHLVVDNASKGLIPSLLEQPGKTGLFTGPILKCKAMAAPDKPVTGPRARPYLKIQDGCDSFCTYCIVPRTRGPRRSIPPEAALAHLRVLSGLGFGEVVLTGIHLGSFGRDLAPPTDLTALLKTVAGDPGMPRVRLSSLEPDEATDALIRVAAKSPKICPHFHLPLQSGDDGVLMAMGRPYTREIFADRVHAVLSALPHAAVGADVLVGFPGETSQAFENTMDIIKSLPLAYLHVFPFSPRPGTPAARFPGRPSSGEVKARCASARGLGQAKRAAFYRAMQGQTAEACVIGPVAGNPGHYRGLTENYVPLVIASDRPLETSRLVRVRVAEAIPEKNILATIC